MNIKPIDVISSIAGICMAAVGAKKLKYDKKMIVPVIIGAVTATISIKSILDANFLPEDEDLDIVD